MAGQKFVRIIALVTVMAISACQAQDYDDDGYGGPGGQGDGDNYNAGNGGSQGYATDDGYSAKSPQYQQNIDSDGSNNPSGYVSSPQASSDADGDYEGDDSSAAASMDSASYARIKRSVPDDSNTNVAEPIKLRVKRHSKYIGPVYTYVKTDKHANFKWGVKHKVGKKHYG